jgi:outer membrane protein TolC
MDRQLERDEAAWNCALRILEREAEQQREAVTAADNALRLMTNLYTGGSGTYLQVITAQEFALLNQRNDVDIHRRRVEASISLVKALGGDWNVASLPALDEHGLPEGAIVPLAH